jgi:site-specific DNA-cytosine methylase
MKYPANQKYCLELFSGQKTVSSVAELRGFVPISVDINPKLNPSICCDILNLKKNTLPGYVSFIWASPECTYFSRAAAQSNWHKKTIKYRIYDYTPLTLNAANSIALVNQTINIINWYSGVLFVIENPVGRIHHSAAIKHLGHYRYFVNYASFGHPFSKETYLFSNMQLPFPTKKYKVNSPGLRSVRNVQTRSSIPLQLIETIFNYLP